MQICEHFGTSTPPIGQEHFVNLASISWFLMPTCRSDFQDCNSNFMYTYEMKGIYFRVSTYVNIINNLLHRCLHRSSELSYPVVFIIAHWAKWPQVFCRQVFLCFGDDLSGDRLHVFHDVTQAYNRDECGGWIATLTPENQKNNITSQYGIILWLEVYIIIVKGIIALSTIIMNDYTTQSGKTIFFPIIDAYSFSFSPDLYS